MLGNHHLDSGTPQNYVESVTGSTYKCHPELVCTRRMRKGIIDLRQRGRHPPEIEPDPCFTLTICPDGDGGVVSWSQVEIDIIRKINYAH